MNRKISIFVLFLAFSLTGCSEDCEPTRHLAVASLPESMVLKDTGSDSVISTTGRTYTNYEPIEVTAEAIHANRLLISLPFDFTEISNVDKQTLSKQSNENRTSPVILPVYMVGIVFDSLLQTGGNNDCGPKNVFKQRISGLEISSDSNISSDYLAGTDVSDLFRVVRSIADFTRKDSGNWNHISSFYNYHPQQNPDVNSAVKSGIYLPEALGLFFDSDVDVLDESVHRFSITLSFENGDVFTITTDPVTLK